MVTKADITTIYNSTFSTNKEYKDLTTYEKIYGLILLTLNNSGGGSTTLDTVTIRDKTNNTNKLSIDSNGQIGINNLTTTENTLNNINNKLPSVLSSDRLKVTSINEQPITLNTGNNAIGSITNTGFKVINGLNELGINGSGQIGISNFPSTQAVSIATLPALATGSNVIGSIANTTFTVTQSGTWNIGTITTLPSIPTGTNTIGSINNISGTISLPTGAATSAKQPALGTAGSSATDVITVQGITNGTALNINQITNATTGTITFTASTTSSTFTITNRLALIIIPVIASAPTLTLQVTLDGGTTWVSTSVTVTGSASAAQTLEADTLAKLSGAFGLTNAFRFSSTASISATLNLRSIVQ